jgi:hypothetical protein
VNVALWIMQVLLALHTVMGAVWKFSNTPRDTPSLHAIPLGVWRALIGVELLLAAGLVLPALSEHLAWVAPAAAGGVAAEMLGFVAVHLRSGVKQHGQMIYWLVVALFSALIVFGRLHG